MQKFSLHYHSFVLIIALYHSVRKIILCWLAAAVTEITTQQYYFQHFRNMLHECLVFLILLKLLFHVLKIMPLPPLLFCGQNQVTNDQCNDISILLFESSQHLAIILYY